MESLHKDFDVSKIVQKGNHLSPVQTITTLKTDGCLPSFFICTVPTTMGTLLPTPADTIPINSISRETNPAYL